MLYRYDMNYYIFDFDGVLADSFQASVQTYMHIHNLPADQYAEVVTLSKDYLRTPNHARNQALSSTQKQKILADYIHWGKIVQEEDFDLFTDVMREIVAIRTQFEDARMAVVTNGSAQYVQPMLQPYAQIFDSIQTIQDSLSKEEKVETVCKQWGITPQEVVYITDTTGDFLELQQTIPASQIFAVTWGWHSYQDLREVMPARSIITHPSVLRFASRHRRVVTIGGGEIFADYASYLQDLKTSAVRLQTGGFKQHWRDWLRVQINQSSTHRGFHLPMPTPDNAQYEEWKIQFERISAYLGSDDLLIGHSLGGIFLLRYLSENPIHLGQVHLVAAPFQNSHSFDFDQEKLASIVRTQAQIHFHHSMDDFVVAFDDYIQYKKALSGLDGIHFHEYQDRNHFLVKEFAELAEIILGDRG